MSESSKEKIFEKAIQILARREHSVREIKTKLSQRGFFRSEIDECVDRLLQLDYLSDTRFLRARVRYLVLQGYGESYIRADLRDKGVCWEDQVLLDAYADFGTSGESQAEAFFQKKYSRKRPNSSEGFDALRKWQRRVMGGMLRRGFSQDQVMKVMRAVGENDAESI